MPDMPKGKHARGPFPQFPTFDSTATFFAQLPKRITLFQYGACPVTGQAPLLPVSIPSAVPGIAPASSAGGTKQ
jgi:hypothetical protein